MIHAFQVAVWADKAWLEHGSCSRDGRGFSTDLVAYPCLELMWK